jgi:hypothetical protein
MIDQKLCRTLTKPAIIAGVYILSIFEMRPEGPTGPTPPLLTHIRRPARLYRILPSSDRHFIPVYAHLCAFVHLIFGIFSSFRVIRGLAQFPFSAAI